MNRRRHVQPVISDYIDGCLSPAAARRVEAHLAECPTCAQELEQWRRVLRLVSTHATVPCPIDCASAVLWRIEAQHRAASRRPLALATRRTLRPTPLLPLLAVALALLGGGTWLWSWSLPASPQSTARALGHWHWSSPLARSRQLSNGRDMLAAGRQGENRGAVSLAASQTPSVPAVRAYAPDRLEGALGRSDSLILAADFAEDDR